MAFGRSIWALFRGLPLWAQLPVGIVGSLFALGLVTAPFAAQPAPRPVAQVEVTEPSTSTTLPATTSSSTSTSTTTTSTSTSIVTTTTIAGTTTTAAPATVATTVTTVPRTTPTTAAVVRTTLAAPPLSCPNGTYTNTAGNEVCRPYNAPTAPAGASAQCKDGSYSFSQTRSGTCSGHGGVSQWL